MLSQINILPFSKLFEGTDEMILVLFTIKNVNQQHVFNG